MQWPPPTPFAPIHSVPCSQWHASDFQSSYRVADLFVKRSKLLLQLQTCGYRLQYVLPCVNCQGPRLQRLFAEFSDGRMMTDTFTDRFGTHPDLPQMEALPSVCQADRCIVLQQHIDFLLVIQDAYISWPPRLRPQCIRRWPEYPWHASSAASGLRSWPVQHHFSGRAGKRARPGLPRPSGTSVLLLRATVLPSSPRPLSPFPAATCI